MDITQEQLRRAADVLDATNTVIAVAQGLAKPMPGKQAANTTSILMSALIHTLAWSAVEDGGGNPETVQKYVDMSTRLITRSVPIWAEGLLEERGADKSEEAA